MRRGPHLVLEAGEVELGCLEGEGVPGRPRLDPAGAERLAELRDVHRHRVDRPQGRLGPPARLHQLIHRDDPTGVERQHGHDGSGLGPAELDGGRAEPYLKGAQETDFEGFGHGETTRVEVSLRSI